MEKEYRKNVGIVVCNKDNRVLMCERKGIENAWQFPQGGIDKGEDFMEASKRELREETSIVSVSLIATIDTPLRYDYPDGVRAGTISEKYWGQEMNWVLYRFTGNEKEIDLQTDNPEFKNYAWFDIDDAPTKIVEFKKDVYVKMVEQFRPFLKS